eukprot:3680400-Rhodomonas_salina.2
MFSVIFAGGGLIYGYTTPVSPVYVDNASLYGAYTAIYGDDASVFGGRFDANGDGKISQSEFITGIKKLDLVRSSVGVEG